MDVLLEPFDGGIGQRALAELLVLAVVCGPLGVWVILFGSSYAAESLAHGMLPGLVIAALAGFPLVLGGAGGLLVAAGLVTLAGRDERIGADTGVAVAVTGLFGLGGVLALAPEVPPRLEELLFGDPLGVRAGDVAVAAAVALVVAIGLLVRHRRLVLAALDPDTAESLGAVPRRQRGVVMALLAVTVAVAVQALGALLVVALLLGPAAAALGAGRRLPTVLALSVGFGAAGAVAGLELSHHLEVAAGAAVAVCLLAPFALVHVSYRLRP